MPQHVEVRKLPVRVWGSNSDHWAWWQAPLSTEGSRGYRVLWLLLNPFIKFESESFQFRTLTVPFPSPSIFRVHLRFLPADPSLKLSFLLTPVTVTSSVGTRACWDPPKPAFKMSLLLLVLYETLTQATYTRLSMETFPGNYHGTWSPKPT